MPTCSSCCIRFQSAFICEVADSSMTKTDFPRYVLHTDTEYFFHKFGDDNHADKGNLRVRRASRNNSPESSGCRCIVRSLLSCFQIERRQACRHPLSCPAGCNLPTEQEAFHFLRFILPIVVFFCGASFFLPLLPDLLFIIRE